MLWVDAQFTRFAGQYNELCLSGEDLFFRRDDVNMNGVCHRKPFFGKSNRVLQQALP